MQLPSTPSFRLDNSRALVSGGNRGIGLAVAVALAEAGSDVCIVARSDSANRALVEALSERGYRAEAYSVDVSDSQAVAQMLATAGVAGGFDILVNCAGLARHKLAIEESEADYDAVMNVNVKAAYFLAQAVARDLIARKMSGSIINISSQMGLVGGLKRSTYCASKHAMQGFTKAMALEWGPHNIRINNICPTFIETEFTKNALAESDYRASVLEKIALGRLGDVRDIMGAAVFLASPASALITGTSLVIDGGWTAA